MILADKKKILYVHIYKTGGSSMTKILIPYITENFRGKYYRTKGRELPKTWHIDNRMHSKFSEALPSVDKLNIDLEEYFKFTFVRNPYSWILSVWNNFFQSPMGNTRMTVKNYLIAQLGKITKNYRFGPAAQYFYEMYPDGGFKNFILFIEYMVCNNPQVAKDVWGCYDQYSFIENDRNIKFDFIGKFESFEDDIKTILKIVDENNILDIPHVTHGSNHNKKDRQKYLSYYDEESIAIVNKIFARDFENFEYQPISNPSQY